MQKPAFGLWMNPLCIHKACSLHLSLKEDKVKVCNWTHLSASGNILSYVDLKDPSVLQFLPIIATSSHHQQLRVRGGREETCAVFASPRRTDHLDNTPHLWGEQHEELCQYWLCMLPWVRYSVTCMLSVCQAGTSKTGSRSFVYTSPMAELHLVKVITYINQRVWGLMWSIVRGFLIVKLTWCIDAKT